MFGVGVILTAEDAEHAESHSLRVLRELGG
jgi:hypothetical protein